MSKTQEIGCVGEQAAAEWLRANGFELRHRNWRHGHYELDIVAQQGDILHIVEVKTRRSGSLTSAEDSITPAKFSSLMRGAQAYIAEYDLNMEVQFDVIAVENSMHGAFVRYIPNAMTTSW